MLGQIIADPEGIEGPPQTVEGLGYLALRTTLTGEKTLRRVSGKHIESGAAFCGYEMHVGVTEGEALSRPLLRMEDGRMEGAISPNGLVAGCYVHGLFSSDAFRAAWLARMGAPADRSLAYERLVEETLDELAEHIARHVDVECLLSLAR
jgi:adenosylcobyric acid synthase